MYDWYGCDERSVHSLEKELKLTRRCLEIIDRYGFGVTVQTKSESVMRDIDLFTKINDKKQGCVTDDAYNGRRKPLQNN